LYYTHYLPKDKAIATVCIIHGFAEYSGRYKHIADFFVAKKYEVLLIDLRGFGYSGGARGCA
jgi:alpha-beta hydrolase superfamily lysophospholipase